MKTTTQIDMAKLCERIKYFGDQSMAHLRLAYPVDTTTSAECVRYTRDHRLTRGDMIAAIILEEFDCD